MTDKLLQKQLRELRQTLDTNPQLDDESIKLLQQIAEDIEDLEVENGPDFTEMVQEHAVNFEQEHPTLAAVLRQIVETLGKIGV